MSKIRRLDVSLTDDSYDITVDGQPTDLSGIQDIIKNLNEYQNELDDMDANISIIMRSLRTTHNLSDDEYREYEQTLKTILKD